MLLMEHQGFGDIVLKEKNGLLTTLCSLVQKVSRWWEQGLLRKCIKGNNISYWYLGVSMPEIIKRNYDYYGKKKTLIRRLKNYPIPYHYWDYALLTTICTE